MYIMEDDLKLNAWQFSQRKYLPYEMKVKLAKTRIQEWYDNWYGQVYLSYSGGLDSTVLLHLIREVLGEEVPAVFCNTGLEYPEIVRFARKASGEFEEIYPKWKDGTRASFKKVVENCGFPITSKESAAKIRKLRHGKLSDRYRNYLLNGDERGKIGMLPQKWRFLIDVLYDISEKCCYYNKEKPFNEYCKRTHRVPYIGVSQDESFRRKRQYSRTGCNIYKGSMVKSQPLGPWTKQDIMRYATENDVEICSIYGDIVLENGIYRTTGEQRTGCMYCAFGAHLEAEPNRFQRMAEMYPRQYEICMNLTNNGVRYEDALEECGIPTKTWKQAGQMELQDYLENTVKEKKCA